MVVGIPICRVCGGGSSGGGGCGCCYGSDGGVDGFKMLFISIILMFCMLK